MNSKIAAILASTILLAGCSVETPQTPSSTERVYIDAYRTALTNDSWSSRVKDDVYLAEVQQVGPESSFLITKALSGGKDGASFYTPVTVSLRGGGRFDGQTVNLALLTDDGSNYNINVLSKGKSLLVFTVGGLVTRSDGIEVLTPSFVGFESDGKMISLSAVDEVSVGWQDALREFGLNESN